MSASTEAADALDASPAAAGLNVVPADPQAELAQYAAVAEAIRAKEAARSRREWLKTVALALAVPAIASGWLAWANNPRIQETVEFVPIAQDGTIASAYRWEALDPRVRGDAALNTVWQYVWMRESFASVGYDLAWRRVTALSAADVRKEFEALADPRKKESPWARYGEKVRVEVSYDSHWDLCSATAPCPDEAGGYAFRFWRTEVQEGVRRPPAMYVAQVRFDRNIPGIDARQRATFNAPAIQVTQYVPGTPAGASNGAGR